ncbi:HAD domain-containing protein [uncultured Algibacter sp.]|uniref:HAD domain-containing protein n=1 Tax=uncultured Algibacter sp. TaxID=298659 RepID=UPI0030ED8D2C|tara:strand:+ start:214 stop:690 length:477 start_codon:yes stop_codon:yes gene_type:complete
MLILLDIDGVMVSGASWRRLEYEKDGFPRFSTKAANSLQKIISETGAGIVLTTSHKYSYHIREWKNIFSTRGINNITSIHRLKRNTKNLNRREEIVKWLETSTDKQYIIIDDDKSLNSLPYNIKKRLIQTSSTVGLNEELAVNAISILNSSGQRRLAV